MIDLMLVRMLARMPALFVWTVSLLLIGCSWFGERAKPSWVNGMSSNYPAEQYLTGVGQSDRSTTAEDQAYAALARVFKTEVSAQAKDWESYLVVEQRGQSRDERRLTVDNLTKVSTDKVLENVRIADRWFDSKKRLYYALAVMQRAQAETAFMEKIAELDRAIQADVDDAHRSSDKLAKVRGLRRAAHNLVIRETYNADLRVVRPSGQGAASPYRVNELTMELEQFLATNLLFAIDVTGDQAEVAQHALSEGLIREGLQIVNRPGADAATGGASGSLAPELLLRGFVRIWPIDVRDPQFMYVRWCGDFEVVEVKGQRLVGAIAKGGREGHLSEREATAKAVRVMQQELSSDVAKAIAGHIYGDSELPAEAIRPAGCPREGAGQKPAAATH
jgi:hypothetical protein